jgi:DNA-binding NarL/FixJ family response regulator
MPPAVARTQTVGMQEERSTHIFIVDDSAAIRTRLAEILASVPNVVIVGEAESASQAIAGILRTQPDSVLLDLNLMGSTGIDVMRAVRPKAPGVVFVVLTNHAEPQYRQASTRAGAAYFLDKSRDFERVPEVIAEIAAARH